MDKAQKLLFGTFPRRVGSPSQHWVYTEDEMDFFIEGVDGRRGAYATVSRLPVNAHSEYEPICDKVLFDLDGDKSPFPDETDDKERIEMMRDDPDLADEVLGDTVDEARKLGRASKDDGIPAVGVFSGFGIHVHQLYQPTKDPKVPMATCGWKYIEELDLQTADPKVIGDVVRICRIPNVERATTPGAKGEVLDGVGTGLWTIPLSASELRSLDVQSLLDASDGPRVPQPLTERERPQMPTWEDYREPGTAEADLPARPVDKATQEVEDDFLETLLKDLLKLPCMYERIQQPNPEHEVRFNAAVLMFNAGLSPHEVANIYSQLGWIDFDRDYTLSQLKYIYQNGYSDRTCQSLREERLCTRAEDPQSCPTYGWSGGEAEWI